MNKIWIIVIGISAIALIAFFILKGGSEKEVITTESTTTSSQTNGLLGAIADIFNPLSSLFGGGGGAPSSGDGGGAPSPTP